MAVEHDKRREMDRRLAALGLPTTQPTSTPSPPQAVRATDAVCMHCHNPFRSTEGHVSEIASLCDLCLGDD